jgi:ribosomal protein S18 acetylase RimI-like enzyme
MGGESPLGQLAAAGIAENTSGCGVPAVIRRPIGPGEDDFIRRVFAQSRDDLLLLPAEARGPLMDMQYRAWRRQIAADHPGATHEVLASGGVDAGLLILDADAERVRVVDIVVARELRGQGIGSGALRTVIDQAGDRVVTLSVWPGNDGARSLYERLGFAVTTETTEGYLVIERRPER